MGHNDLEFFVTVGLPIAIVGMILTYRLISKRMDMAQKGRSTTPIKQGDASELQEKAEDLNRRLANLEEILTDHKPPES